jgi:hypothetical protein
MAEYLDIDFESDADALSQVAFNYLQTLVPNWVPTEGNLDVMLIRAISHIAAEVQDLASTVPTTIFRYQGAVLFNVPPIEATSAQALTDWTMRDSAGYTVPAGTLVGIRLSGDDLVPFQTLSEFTIPPGDTTEIGVIIEAVNPGADGSGLTGSVELIDSIGFVQGIVLEGPTTGGVDAEEDAAYLNRLSLQLQLLAPRPIVPSDFAAMAIDVPGVHRALALDGYDPAADTFDNERMVAVAVIDELGQPVSTLTKNSVQTLLDSHREVNFIVNMLDPTYTTVDVTFQVKAEAGFDATDLQARIIAAITDFVSPATWGLPSTGDTIEWRDEDTVRYLSLADVVNSVQGVRYIESLAIGLLGGSQIAGDRVLFGNAPLPSPGTILGSVDL